MGVIKKFRIKSFKNPQPLISLENISLSFGKRKILDNVSFKINHGQILGMLGPNGVGKSTIFNLITGLIKPDYGKIKFEGIDVVNYPIYLRTTKFKIGYVPQKISIDWTLPLRVKDFMVLTENIKDDQINEALSLTGVMHLKNKNLGNLSGGEFQRVLLARAISKKPELLVLDEPVQGVDYTGEIALYALIKKISDTLNCGILLISHDLHTVMTATDHVVCLNGHVCCSGSPIDVAKNSEYKTLFGEQASQILSVYEHKHDHEHSDEGNIKKN